MEPRRRLVQQVQRLWATPAREMRDQSERLTSGRVTEDLDYLVSSDLGEVFTNTRGSLGIAYAFDSTTSNSAAIS